MVTKSSKPFEAILGALAKRIYSPAKKTELTGILPPARAFLVAQLCLKFKNSLLIVARDNQSARMLHSDLDFFWPFEKGNCLYFYPLIRAELLSREMRIERIEALEGLRRTGEGAPAVAVAPLGAIFQQAPHKEVFSASVFEIKCGDVLDRDILSKRLSDSGYQLVDMVEEVGDYSIRGGIMDVFPPLYYTPLRIEFFGDTLDSIREFNPADQLSIRRIEKAQLLPVKEPSFREQASLSGNLQSLEGTIFEYLGPDGVIVLDEAGLIREKMKAGQIGNEDIQEAEEDIGFPSSLRRPRNIEPAIVAHGIDRGRVLEISTLPLQEKADEGIYALLTNALRSFRGRFYNFIEQLKQWMAQGYSVVLVSHNEYQARRMKALLEDYDLGAKIHPSFRELVGNKEGRPHLTLPPLSICVGSLSSGFEFPAAGMVVMTEAEVFGAVKKVREKRKHKAGKFFSDFRDLHVGDYVVHVDYGIGRYLGMFHLNLKGRNSEFLKIQYDGGQYLYVPVESLNLVQKYMGSGDGHPKLDRLGSSAWKRKKANVKESIRQLARELLELYAARSVLEGHAFSPDNHWAQEFESAFEFEETPDQLKAIEEVKADMERPTVMDRLICGDVGYGKTEVAMRASFKAVMDSKQAAILVPTTILAQQHFNNFSRRFKLYPISVEMFTRFRTRQEQKAIMERLSRGEIDIIIGTHRLLQEDVRFKDLGLVVIDEEQRFGVRQKEILKQLRKSVDVLILTATPIPRTLHLSLMGARDLSIIDTPPEDRLSIETHLVRFSDAVIQKAVMSEMARGGQIYFVHNRVESLEAMRKYLRRLAPEVRIGVVHGQLPERILEKKMIQFLDREFDLLLTTTIIESGLDIPSVNTIIVNRADRFGLAQLYQLRGRVGRDKYQAYAYFLVPAKEAISDLAMKRLKAIQEFTELGSGFRLAARDMEIRGAGNILGAEQSGHIAAVGFDLYCRLIEETVQELKGEEYKEEVEPEMELGYHGLIPQDYMTDTNLRLMTYKKFASLRGIEELTNYARELEDRYGKLPLPMERLLEYFELRILAKALKVERLKIEDETCIISFHTSTPLDPLIVIDLVKRRGDSARFLSENSVQIKLNALKGENVFIGLKKMLQHFINRGNLNTN